MHANNKALCSLVFYASVWRLVSTLELALVLQAHTDTHPPHTPNTQPLGDYIWTHDPCLLTSTLAYLIKLEICCYLVSNLQSLAVSFTFPSRSIQNHVQQSQTDAEIVSFTLKGVNAEHVTANLHHSVDMSEFMRQAHWPDESMGIGSSFAPRSDRIFTIRYVCGYIPNSA